MINFKKNCNLLIKTRNNHKAIKWTIIFNKDSNKRIEWHNKQNNSSNNFKPNIKLKAKSKDSQNSQNSQNSPKFLSTLAIVQTTFKTQIILIPNLAHQ
jgi:hypothetical protein